MRAWNANGISMTRNNFRALDFVWEINSPNGSDMLGSEFSGNSWQPGGGANPQIFDEPHAATLAAMARVKFGYNQVGFMARNFGNTTIPNGDTDRRVTIPHGLGYTPMHVMVWARLGTNQNALRHGEVGVSNYDGTNITIDCAGLPTAYGAVSGANILLDWEAFIGAP